MKGLLKDRVAGKNYIHSLNAAVPLSEVKKRYFLTRPAEMIQVLLVILMSLVFPSAVLPMGFDKPVATGATIGPSGLKAIEEGLTKIASMRQKAGYQALSDHELQTSGVTQTDQPRRQELSGRQTTKLDRLKKELPGIEIHLYKRNGTKVFVKHSSLDTRKQALERLAYNGRSHKAGPKNLALSTLHEYRDLFEIDNAFEEFELKSDDTDKDGRRHIKVRQVYLGIPVWGKELIVHQDKDDAAYLIEGTVETTPLIDIAPDISVDQAIDIVRSDLGDAGAAAPELVIHCDDAGTKRLAYHLVVFKGGKRWKYFVDAKTGDILEKYNDTWDAGVQGTGTDLLGQQKNFGAWQEGNTFQLFDTSLPMHKTDPSFPQSLGEGNIVILDLKGQTLNNNNVQMYAVVSNTADSGWDNSGVSLVANIRATYNYFKTTHNRDSIDNKGMNVNGLIHMGGGDDAFWNGTSVNFGDGATNFKPLAGGLDVVAHEFTHGVTQYSAGLEYKYQSGALNEAFSDIFASMIDREDWLMGEDVLKVAPGYLRSLADPNSGFEKNPANMQQYQNLPLDQDNGGVHVNCVIPGHAAYYMAEGLTKEGLGTSIGRNKLELIFYKTLTQHLTSQSDFKQARLATIQSAEELYGKDSAEVAAVKAGWDAVGVVEGAGGGGTGEVPVISGADDMVVIGYRNEWNPESGNYVIPYLIAKPAAAAAFFISGGAQTSETRPAIVDGGKSVLYVDTLNNLVGADISSQNTMQVIISNKDAEIRTIAGSQDGRYFACTTKAYDNKIYVLDTKAAAGQQLKVYDLYAPTDTGAKAGMVHYANVIEFDITGQKILFDAVNEINLGGTEGYKFWNIGVIDLRSGKIMTLIPSPPQGVHIGHPSASNTRDWLIAADIVDERDASKVVYMSVAINLLSGKMGVIAQTTNPTEAFGRPSFNGDDSLVAFEYNRSVWRVPIIHKPDDTFEGDITNALEFLKPDSNPDDLYSFRRVGFPRYYRVGSRLIKPVINLSDNSLNFSKVPIGQTSSKTLTISNTGNYDLTIDNLQLTGTNLDQFRQNATQTKIAPGASLSVAVSFNPTSTGVKNAVFSIYSSDTATPKVDVSLTAEGVQQYVLTVAKTGTGSGTVTSVPAGINCGTDCTETYNANTAVTLTATAAAGSTFTGWTGGGCTGTGTCQVTMDAAKNVTAAFAGNTYVLTVAKTGTGSGTVTSVPAGINCGTDCTETYNANTAVTLTAAAAAGSTFTGWTGAGCAGTGTCQVTMDSAKNVTAAFALTGPPDIKVSNVLLMENFDAGIPVSWTNADTWATDEQCPGALASPFSVHWIKADSSCNTTTTEILTTKVFSVKNCASAEIAFTSQSEWNGGQGRIDVSANNGSTWLTKLNLSTNEGPLWKKLAINEIAGSSNAKARFVYNNSASRGYWAIDNVWLTCLPAALDYTADNEQKALVIENTGQANLNIGQMSINGTNASDFSLQNDSCSNRVLATSGSCSAEVRFTTTARDKRSAEMSIPSNDPDTATARVMLSGMTTAIGDADGSGTMNIIDALFVARHAAGLSVAAFILDAADVNCDGAVNIVDALFIARKAAGLSVTGWCGN